MAFTDSSNHELERPQQVTDVNACTTANERFYRLFKPWEAASQIIRMTTPQLILIAASCVYLIVMVVTAYLTRATRRRVTGALIGGAAVGLVGVGVECLAHAMGWWRYPFVETAYGPPLIYPVAVLLFAALALVGWRVTRRFGWRGQAAFLSAVTVVGTLRDYRIAAWLPQFIVFAPGIGTVLVDAACWAGLLALAQTVMCFVAGPVRDDALARRPHEPPQATESTQ